MEMSWDKLADRCQLYTDANKGMLIELLKEAEQELARECDLLEGSETWDAPFDSRSDYCVLPLGYTSMQSVHYNGNRLERMDESEMSLNENNVIRNGTPSRYYIEMGEIPKLKFDYEPQSGRIKAHFRKVLTTGYNSKLFINRHTATSSCFLETSLGTELNGLLGKFYDADTEQVTFDTLTYITDWVVLGVYSQKFSIDSGTPTIGDIVEIFNYHSVAPVIPSQYHRDLCDYAIAIASAKANPELHNKHLSIWMNNIEKIKNEDADRELIHTIRREI